MSGSFSSELQYNSVKWKNLQFQTAITSCSDNAAYFWLLFFFSNNIYILQQDRKALLPCSDRSILSTCCFIHSSPLLSCQLVFLPSFVSFQIADCILIMSYFSPAVNVQSPALWKAGFNNLMLEDGSCRRIFLLSSSGMRTLFFSPRLSRLKTNEGGM